MKEETKTAIFIISICILFVGIMFVPIHMQIQESEAKYERLEKNCEKLDAKYGDYFAPTKGFYQGIGLKATGTSHYYVELLNPETKEEMSFFCGDVKKSFKPEGEL